MAQSQYAEASDIVALGIPQATAARFGTTAINAQLQAASSIADQYISASFTLPLVSWTYDLRLIVCSIAVYYLYFQYGISDNDHLIENRYKSALEWLGRVADKTMHPQWVDSSGSTTDGGAGNFMVSDQCVGFTSRGVTSGTSCIDWWYWS
jgi:phage gp36-like protein